MRKTANLTKGVDSRARTRTGMMAEAAKNIHRIFFEQREVIDAALKQGVREAILAHKRENLPIVIERNGQIEWVKPEDLGY